MSQSGPSNKPRAAPAAPPPPPVAVVVSRYNDSITAKLLHGATSAYLAAGGSEASLIIIDAPGAYELVALSAAAARTGHFAGVVALGCVIKGETEHDRYIASAVAHGLAQLSVTTGIPAAFGVLTVNTPRQARDRAGGVLGNKGTEAMNALLATIDQIRSLNAGASPVQAPAPSLPDKAARNGAAGGRKAKPAAAAARGGGGGKR